MNPNFYFNSHCLAKSIEDFWKKGYSQLGLSPASANLILLINENPGIIQKEAAAYLHLEKSTLSRAVDKLENDGLLRRKVLDSENKKEKCLFPTRKSKNMYPKITEINTRLEKELTEKIGSEKIERFNELVSKLIETDK